MKKIIRFMSSLIALSLCFSASALEGNFTAKIRTIGLPDDQVRIIAVAQFEDTNILTDGSFSVDFGIFQYEDVVYSGTATINSDQTEVINGTVATGRTKMTYDPETGRITARLVIKDTKEEYASYDVGAYTSIGSNEPWGGNAIISAQTFNIIDDIDVIEVEPIDVH